MAVLRIIRICIVFCIVFVLCIVLPWFKQIQYPTTIKSAPFISIILNPSNVVCSEAWGWGEIGWGLDETFISIIRNFPF